MTDTHEIDVQRGYDQLAEAYAEHIAGELAHKPFDRKMLEWLIEKVGGLGAICDMGCGPGHVARYLADHGAQAEGIDLSSGMIEQARRLNPHLTFRQGDMTALTAIPDQSYGGIAAAYAIVNIPPDRLPLIFAEFRRILRPGGTALISFHTGDEVRHITDLWGVPSVLDFYFYKRETIKTLLTGAGLRLDECIERDPYPEIESQTVRTYLFCHRDAE
ncbi:MAG: class I SAM-dependent methyltransferase [Anaerolineae bacterium]